MTATAYLLSVDPGARGCGSSMFRGGRLVGAAYVSNPVEEGSGPRECAEAATAVFQWALRYWMTNASIELSFALEWPQIYSARIRDGSNKGDPNDLLALCGVNGALAALAPAAKVTYFRPREWKQGSQKPKKTKLPYVVEAKVRRRLDESELATIEWGKNVKKTWDITDSIGIGLTALGRFERFRVFARE